MISSDRLVWPPGLSMALIVLNSIARVSGVAGLSVTYQ